MRRWGAELSPMPEERIRSVLTTIMESGHFSTLEHAFAVDGVRALTHQLVRHRIASFNQQSQRYVKFKDGVDVVTRHGAGSLRRCRFRRRRGASKLLDAGAVRLLPNAAESKIVITMNVRELLHFFQAALLQLRPVEIRGHGVLARPTAPFVFRRRCPLRFGRMS